MNKIRNINSLRPHHREAIKKLSEYLFKKDRYLALIIGGSIAKGYERDNSDIDIFLVVSEENFKKSHRRNRLTYYNNQYCDYPDGYFDGKIIDRNYLNLVAERGSEVARSAFIGSWIEFSKLPDLDNILEKIPIYQKQEKEEKIQKFYAQFEYAKWSIDEAFKLNNQYLLERSVADLILFGGRLILAHNEILFPYHRWFMKVLEEAPEKPVNFMSRLKEMMKNKNPDNIQVIYDSIKSFTNWNVKLYWTKIFMRDTELAWIDNKAYIGDI